MFKKLKDKFGEELKQSPLRISASVQQLAQAISPSSSASPLQENQNAAAVPLPDALSVPTDFFSIGDDHDNVDPSKTLHHVDLTPSSPSILPPTRSRRSSISSVASDVSSLFPIYESPLNHSFLQSECESELEDGAAHQLEKISKEQLYQGYKKLLYRYNKYKGRFVDLSRVYKDLQYENIKTKNVLQESQDKALRRIAELREQCQLEQKAKAHLEESLRNDLEERDHMIETLNTKIGLLKGSKNTVDQEEPLLAISNEKHTSTDNNENLRAKNEELTIKLEKLTKALNSHSTSTNGPALEPISTEQVKVKITELKSGIGRLKSENEIISNMLSKSPPTSEFGDEIGTLIDLSSPETDERDKKIEKLNNLLLKCKEKISSLNMDIRRKNTEVQDLTEKLSSSREEVDNLSSKMAELNRLGEESVLSIAENKMAIHKELETKEVQIKELTKQLEHTKSSLHSTALKLSELQAKHKQDIALLEQEKTRLTEEISKTKGSTATTGCAIDSACFEKEKERLNVEMEAILLTQQNKLEMAFEKVNRKIHRAEGNISRLCADRLIASRSSELELLQKIENLERQVEDGGITGVRYEELEKEMKALQETALEKQKKIDDDAATIAKLNEELNEKIDRIVDLGDELEESTSQLKMQLESSEGKKNCLAKEKSELEQKGKDLWQKYTDLQRQSQAYETETVNLRSQISSLTEVNEKLQTVVATIENKKMEYDARVTELQEILSAKEEELLHTRSDKVAIVRQHEESIAQLSAQLHAVKISVVDASKYPKQLVDLEEQLKNREDELESLKLHLNQKDNIIFELETKQQSLIEKMRIEMKKIAEETNLKQVELETISQRMKEREEECVNLKAVVEESKQQNIGLEENLQDQVKLGLACDALRDECDRLNKLNIQKEEEQKNLEAQFKSTEFDLKIKLEESNNAKVALEGKVKELRNTLIELEESLKKHEEKANEKLEEVLAAKKSIEERYAEQCCELEEHQKRVEYFKKVKENYDSDLLQIRTALVEKEKILGDVMQSESKLKCTLAEYETKIDSFTHDCDLKGNELIKALELESKLKNTLAEYEAKIDSLTNDLDHERKELATALALDSKQKIALADYETKIKNLVNDLEKRGKELDATLESELQLKATLADCEAKIGSLTNDLNSAKSQLIDVQQSIDGDSNKLKDECLSKVNILKNEIKFLNDKFESEVANIEGNREREMSEINVKLTHSENTASELMNKLESIAAERDELKQTLEEKAMKVTELEGCLSELKSDLDKNFNDKSRTNPADLEDLYEGKLKKIVSEYEMEIEKRDNAMRDLELQISEQKEAVEMLKSLRQEVKTLRKELKEKDDIIENIQEEQVEFKKESENKLLNIEIDNTDMIEVERRKIEEIIRLHKLELEDQLSCQKAEYEKVLTNQRSSFEREIERIRNEREESVRLEKSKCEEKVQVLEDSFKKERTHYDVESNPIATSDDSPEIAVEELECTSKVAVAVVESSAESMELLRKKIMLQDDDMKELRKQHKREVLELKKIAGFRSRRYSEREQQDLDVEHEYLRNILYEYMMGKEQMVLAKVLAAIVKFDSQQTQNVLDRQSSVGQLRIL